MSENASTNAERLAAIYRALVRSLPQQSVIVFDPSLRVLIADGAEMLAGVRTDGHAILGRNIAELSTPQNAERLRRMYEDAVAGIEHRIEAERFGRALSIRTCPVRDESGEIIGGMVVSTDITARVAAEQELRRQAEVVDRQRQLFANALGGIAWLDKEGRFVQVNEEYARAAGYSPEELVGRSWRDTVAPRHIASGEAHVARMFASGRAENEIVGLRKDGSTFYKRVLLVASHDDAGQLRGYCAFTTDITEMRRAFDEAVRARQVAEQAMKARSEFLARMSHEIRTPMNGVIGLTDLVLGSELTAWQREQLGAVSTSAQSLLGVINDVLDFSKIDAGKLEIEALPFSAREQLGAAIQPLRAAIEAKGLELVVRVDERLPDAMVSDPNRCRQIFTNLLGNACKFTARGRIEVEIAVVPGPSDATVEGVFWIELRVSDTGIGIPRDKLGEIFSPFTQVDGATARHFGGTGLGLSICHQLVGLMGGTISVESEPGVGSRFVVRLPMRKAPLGREVASQSRGPGAIRARRRTLEILVAEDNKINRRLAQGLLERVGHHATLVENGVQAVAAVAGHRFDVVLMDVQMPEMDGLQATRAIRAAEGTSGTERVPILALTAQAMVGDAEECLAAGMDGYISKPIDVAELMAAIERVTAPATLPQVPAEAASRSAPR